MHTSCVRRSLVAGLVLAIGLTLVAPSPASAETPPSPDQVFVERLYANVLGRSATTAEKGYWLQQLGAGMPRTTVAVRVGGSPEGRGVLVTKVYRIAFDFERVPGAAEKAYWVGRLAAGRSVEAMGTDFTASPEIHRIGGGSYFPDTKWGQSAHLFAFYLSRLVQVEPDPPRPDWVYWADRIAADPSSAGVHRTALAFGRVPDATTVGIGRGLQLGCPGPSVALTPAQRSTLGATWTAARQDIVRLAAVAVAVVCPAHP
ncbi:MAG TPA: DUF4214 domain-containing protein [Iamia sp.]|nr:DUF4214 domain-containing protein [Iamia sp.]